jgi:predicted TPR repeat methyltransferase
MPSRKIRPLWRERLQQIPSEVEAIHLPDVAGLPQDREWCDVVVAGVRRRIRFHDYHEIYEIPGLYERLFYEKLQCNSPTRVARLLFEVMSEVDDSPANLRVLDIGAGNGMVGEQLRALGANCIAGIDIIPEAREAALRDRPGVYHDYFVADLTDLLEPIEKRLRKLNLNALSVVAALGFDDIPAKAFLKALDLIETPGWLAFNIKETFIHEGKSSGFSSLIRQLSRTDVIQMQAYRRYQHRLSIAGDPLYYAAVVARKLKDVPDELMAEGS